MLLKTNTNDPRAEVDEYTAMLLGREGAKWYKVKRTYKQVEPDDEELTMNEMIAKFATNLSDAHWGI